MNMKERGIWDRIIKLTRPLGATKQNIVINLVYDLINIQTTKVTERLKPRKKREEIIR